MSKRLFFIVFLFAAPLIQAQQDFKADFEFLWSEIDSNYAYFERQGTDWDAVKEHYLPLTDTVSHPYYFTLFLETVLRELADSHTHLRTNTDRSQRLLPSGTDLKVGFFGDRLVVLETRLGSEASKLLKPGDEILSVNGQPVSTAIAPFVGKFQDESKVDIHRDNAANILLAGDYRTLRYVDVNRGDKRFVVNLGVSPYPNNEQELISSKLLDGNIGYIKIENSLGNTDLIAAFDEILDGFMTTEALILDLRNTPSGGDAIVGKPLLGRFTDTPKPYQTHNRPSEQKTWTETVHPRGAYYGKPVYVLVNFWTGSMGEGIAIGLDAFGNATVVGTPMAGLLGANYTVNLPHSNYGLNITFERLYHVDGTPREDFFPEVKLSTHDVKTQGDAWLEKALELIND